jgi:hypothetical protein
MHSYANRLAVDQFDPNFIKLVYANRAGQDNPGVM